MSTSTVTSKGQITIPVEVRRALKLEAGSRVEFVELANGTYELIPATRAFEGTNFAGSEATVESSNSRALGCHHRSL